ncbi:MAG: hypothetical protein AAB393_04465 [Bacteroidota bacterium]
MNHPSRFLLTLLLSFPFTAFGQLSGMEEGGSILLPAQKDVGKSTDEATQRLLSNSSSANSPVFAWRF